VVRPEAGEETVTQGERIDVDTIVFDLFHTLVDPQEHAPPGYRRIREVAGILGLPEHEVELWWEQRVPVLVSEPVYPVDEVVEWARSRRIVLDPSHIADIDRALGVHADSALRSPIDGVVETLQHLRSVGLGLTILSNVVVRDVRTFPLSPLAPLVDDACFSCFTGMVKPNPVAFTGVLDRLGSTPVRAIYVGDGGSDELGGARRSGYAGVVCIRGPVARGGWRAASEQAAIEMDADLVIEDVVELPGVLGV
jgi:putative hydrolase of the HAD superfamily